MSVRRRVLLVSPTTPLAKTLSRCVRHAGYEVTVVPTFQAARAYLNAPLDLLITELKLGESNGLQLALRLATTGIPAIVVAEKAFEHEVEQLGAVWLAQDTAAAADELPALMARLVQGPGSTHGVYSWYAGHETDAASSISPIPPPETTPGLRH